MRALTLLTVLYLALILVLLGWAAKEAGATPVHHHPQVCHHAHRRVICHKNVPHGPAKPQEAPTRPQVPPATVAAPPLSVEPEVPFTSEEETDAQQAAPVNEAELESWFQPPTEEVQPSEEGEAGES